MRAGPGFGNGALFTLKVRIELGQNYTVFLRSVGNDGSVSTNISTPFTVKDPLRNATIFFERRLATGGSRLVGRRWR